VNKTTVPSGHGLVVLAVDDDPGTLQVIEARLSQHDYVVKTAPSGEAALELLNEITPAVLILDVMMPGISGYDLCHFIKRVGRLKNIPVIFLTSRGTPKDFQKGHGLGAVIYMVKPFKSEQLLHIVQMVSPKSA
jgi:DNA-binding response OmpR family regulator